MKRIVAAIMLLIFCSGIVLGVLAVLDEPKRTQDLDGRQVATKIQAEAEKNHPGDPVAQSIAKNKALEDELSKLATKSGWSPKRTAATAFVAYYGKNTDAIPLVCAMNDVKVDKFVAEFRRSHSDLLEVAGKSVDVEQILRKSRLAGSSPALGELTALGEMMGTDMAGTCRWLEENHLSVMEKVRFAAVMPRMHGALVAKDG